MHPGMQEALRGVQFQTYGVTVLNPVAFALVLLMGILLVYLPRRYAIIPFIAVALFFTDSQRLVVATLDFEMLRIMILFGIIRVLYRSEYRLITINQIDKIMICYVVWGVIAGVLLWGTIWVFINRCGNVFTVLGFYFLCRILIQDLDDFERAIKAIVIMSVPIALLMLNEQLTSRNIFSVLGGVPEITKLREGRLRSQGAFSHPIMAGTFGATLMPLVVGCWFRNKHNLKFLLIGIISCTLITITSSSSGPLISYFAAMIGLILWSMRNHMKSIIGGGIACIIGLHIVMKAPVWFLIARVNIVGGSGGSHRARLIDKAIEYFHEWWLLGTYGSGHWGWGLEDVTNWYVRHCINGGLLYIILFIVIICLCFKAVVKAVRSIENQPDLQKFIWAMGACLFSHTASFIGVTYFGQIIFFWFLILAMLSTVSSMNFRNSLVSSER